MLVQLDSNIVSGLVLDELARTCVREYRRNGAKILLSPSVVRELARARLPVREKLIAAAIEYCDGFTNLPVLDMLALEIRCINDAQLVPPVPIVPIRELRRALSGAFAPRPGGLNAKQRKANNVEMLEDIKRASRGKRLQPSFEEFLKSWRGPILGWWTDRGADAGWLPKLKPREDGTTAHSDKYGVAAMIGMIAANMYRKRKGTMLKGEGCFSDLENFLEIAHSDVLLTRDEELFECGKLLRTVAHDARPEIRLVPQP